ncbi:MAG: glucuronate isomerase, partial [Rhodoglobus sp.]
GTPSRYWLESELASFGVTEQPSAENADAVFDAIGQRLAEPQFRPRALLQRYGIDVLATTDDPCSDLSAHAALAAVAGLAARVIPTFRPDRYLDPAAPGWLEGIGALTDASGHDATSYPGYLDALRARRRYFIEHGATATDHGVADAGSEPLEPADAHRLHGAALAGTITADEAVAYRRNMLFEMARMSTEDGLVMQLHPGILRNHDRATFERFGADTGHDLPLATGFTEPLRPLLEQFGNDPRFRIVLFTVDETAFSRDIAPLAGYYPAVFIGAPWWFLDAPDAIGRFRSAAVETAGFSKMAGFVDDTRAFCSIPARHDMSRRSDAAFLARLVVEHRMSQHDAVATIENLVVHQPRRVFTRTVA